eukprot:TRINITY_DN3909_c0_g4_i1.p1 TRINITY_DN3909_c0_g4~~TRINITY_DN3909_c0_g4_i1.p1  ORF type:complete len:442 (-),score=78.55 TRINITY_DN3909_c0_g4_i1:1353-2678(-)
MNFDGANKDNAFVPPDPEVISVISQHLRLKVSDLINYMRSREHPYSLVGNRFSSEDIQQVQHLIEVCLELYVTKFQVIAALHANANVEPGFTNLVWQKLEEQNQSFFEAYRIRCHLKEQITLFNQLVQKQEHIITQLHPQSQNQPASQNQSQSHSHDMMDEPNSPPGNGLQISDGNTGNQGQNTQRSRMTGYAPPKLDISIAQKYAQSTMGPIVMAPDSGISPLKTDLDIDQFFQFTPTSNGYAQSHSNFDSPSSAGVHMSGTPNIFQLTTPLFNMAQGANSVNGFTNSSGYQPNGVNGMNIGSSGNETPTALQPKQTFIGNISPLAFTGLSPLAQLFPSVVYLSPMSGLQHKYPASYMAGISPTSMAVSSGPSPTTSLPSNQVSQFPNQAGQTTNTQYLGSFSNGPIVAVRPMSNQNQTNRTNAAMQMPGQMADTTLAHH